MLLLFLPFSHFQYLDFIIFLILIHSRESFFLFYCRWVLFIYLFSSAFFVLSWRSVAACSSSFWIIGMWLWFKIPLLKVFQWSHWGCVLTTNAISNKFYWTCENLPKYLRGKVAKRGIKPWIGLVSRPWDPCYRKLSPISVEFYIFWFCFIFKTDLF